MQSPTCVASLAIIPFFENMEEFRFIVEPTMLNFASSANVKEMVAAVYSVTDMIIFKVMEDEFTQTCIVEVCITIDDINDTCFTIPFSEMDEALLNVYNFVKSKSSMEVVDGTSLSVRGTHIGRAREYNYSLFTLMGNPIGDIANYSITYPSDEQIEIYENMNRNMIAVKRL